MTLSDASPHLYAAEDAKSTHPWSGRDWAAVALLGLLVALFFWRIITPNLNDRASFPPGDFSYQFWAFSTLEARELSAGRLPLWNPYTYSGAPYWADIQSAVLYPPSLLTLLLSGLWGGFSLFALEVEAIGHFWLAGTFTYLFARRLIRHRGAALFAAITFTFGGYLTGYPSQQLAVLETAVWLPLLLYFADRALVDRSGHTPNLRPNLPDILAAGLVFGVALLAGHPQSGMFVIYTLLLYVTFLILTGLRHQHIQPPASSSGAKRLLGSVLTPLAIILIGLGLAAIAWLPGLEYMRLSVRAAGLYENMSGGFPLYDAIQVLLPGSVSFYSPLYVGVLPLLLAIWAALKPRRRETAFWGVLAAVAFLLSFGGETFLYSPFYLLAPGFSIFRDQERAAFIVSFALAILAGYGFKFQTDNQQGNIHPRQATPAATTAHRSGQAGLKSAVGWLLMGAIGSVILFFYALNAAGWQDDSPFNLLLSRSIWLTIVLGLVWGVMEVRDRALRSGPSGSQASSSPRSYPTGIYRLLPTSYSIVAVCYLLLATLDLFTINWKTNIHLSLPEDQTAVPGIVQAIQRDAAAPEAIFRVYNEYRIYENYGVPYILEDAWGASPLRLARYDDMYRSLRMERVWELLNVKYVITWREELYAPSEIIYQEPADQGMTYVHRLNHVAPRVWLVYRVQESREDDTLAQLDNFDFDPAQEALVPVDTRLSVEPPPPNEHGQVTVVHQTPNALALNVNTPSDGLLVLSEIYYPGWHATIDGQASAILRVNYALRGIPVAIGQHQVKIFYRPVTFVLGAAISCITLATLAVAGIWGWRHHKFPRS
jgi:hypothetical protein